MKTIDIKNFKERGYTLIETLVASSVMMVAIAAASSLSLTMVTQEEISERTVRATNHFENAITLYQLGLDPDEIIALLPAEPAVSQITFTPQSGKTVAGLGAIDPMEMKVTYSPSGATSKNKKDEASWTGGDNKKERSHTVVVIRSTQQ